MIWAMLDAINTPEGWAMTRERDGSFRLAPVDNLPSDARVVGSKGSPMFHRPLVNELFDIAKNEEFTEHQRKEQMAIALDEAAKPQSAPTFMVDEILGATMIKERTADGIRFSFPPTHPPT